MPGYRTYSCVKKSSGKKKEQTAIMLPSVIDRLPQFESLENWFMENTGVLGSVPVKNNIGPVHKPPPQPRTPHRTAKEGTYKKDSRSWVLNSTLTAMNASQSARAARSLGPQTRTKEPRNNMKNNSTPDFTIKCPFENVVHKLPIVGVAEVASVLNTVVEFPDFRPKIERCLMGKY